MSTQYIDSLNTARSATRKIETFLSIVNKSIIDKDIEGARNAIVLIAMIACSASGYKPKIDKTK